MKNHGRSRKTLLLNRLSTSFGLSGLTRCWLASYLSCLRDLKDILLDKLSQVDEAIVISNWVYKLSMASSPLDLCKARYIASKEVT